MSSLHQHHHSKEYSLFKQKLSNNYHGVYLKKTNYPCANISKLSDFSKKLKVLMTYFVKNDVRYLIENFTYEVYLDFGNYLNMIKLNPVTNPEYEEIRNVLKISVELLYSYVIQYKKIKDIGPLMKKLEEQEKILNSLKLLKERMEELQKQINLFDDTHISMPEVEVYTEMIIYVQRYGFPENGVFDPEKLNEIIAELNNS